MLFTVFSPCIILSQDYTANPELNQGIADLKAENYEEAVVNLTKARKNDPSSSIAAYYLGLAYKQQQEYKEAIVHLKDAVTLRPGVKDGFLDLAELYYYTGQSEESLKQLGFAEEKNVRPAQTAFLKGLVLMRLERNKEAMEASTRQSRLKHPLFRPPITRLAWPL
ncbi:MAG: tetratricopeptide repeat protein [Deltaproteobacteria bacterium]